MLKRTVLLWIARGCAIATLLVLFGCSTSKPYALVAQLPPLSRQARIVAATIDVTGMACAVRIVTLDSPKAWAPVCLVDKDEPTYKSFSIAGKEVDFGAVGAGFKVLTAVLPTLPAPASTAKAAVTHVPAKKGVAAVGAQTTAAPAAASLASPVVAAPSFPEQWTKSPYPGDLKLQGENMGYLVTGATLTIRGSRGTLHVTFKTSYLPLHLHCTVVADENGNFTLWFNPSVAAALTGGGSHEILLTSEGASITGNIWDSHGFDSWTPSLPPQWSAVSYSSD